MTVRGGWVHHSEYGRQFRADSFEKRIPEDADSILKYLSSGVIKGIGPKTAARIVDKYGADTFEVLSEHPDWIAEFKGISARRALEISEEIRRQMGFYKLFDFCKDYCSMTVACGSIRLMKTLPFRCCVKIRIGFAVGLRGFRSRSPTVSPRIAVMRKTGRRVSLARLYRFSSVPARRRGILACLSAG